jgi:small subunit ribosomal protein S2
MAQSSTGSDWNWLLTFLIFVVVLAVALIIQAFFSSHDASELEFHEHKEGAHHAEEAHIAAALQPEPEPQAEPEAPVEAEPEPQAEAEPEPQAEAEPEPEPETPTEPDALQKLEGIGPKVASLLHENGITTFAQLADTPVDKLQEILDANKLQMIHPGSWPEQAKLAAAGDWDALQKLQDGLKGGR